VDGLLGVITRVGLDTTTVGTRTLSGQETQRTATGVFELNCLMVEKGKLSGIRVGINTEHSLLTFL
jgi:hypothetical protein